MILVAGLRHHGAAAAAPTCHAGSLGGLILKVAAIVVGLQVVVWYLNLGRGVPWMFGLFVLLVVVMNYAFTRTKWGRSMTAVGGNAEAARRAGINVRRIYLSAFALCSMFAAFGGVLSAARLATASQQAGHRRREPQRHRGGGDRRHQPLRRARQRLVGAARASS